MSVQQRSTDQSPNGVGRFAARALLLLIGLIAVFELVRTRGTSSTHAEPIASTVVPESALVPASVAPASSTLGVALRLVDLLGDAVYDAPEAAKAQSALDGYWRRAQAPYVSLTGARANAVQNVALVRQGGKTPVVDLGSGRIWKPNQKIWNMGEGSFDQREAIVAPAPAVIRYHVKLPVGALFEAAPAIVHTSAKVTFEVAVVAGGQRRVLASKNLIEETRRWQDWRVDLGAFAGQTVDLELANRVIGHMPPEGALAFWGTPTVLAPGASSLPFNVMFIVIDALRGDAVSATHGPDLDDPVARAAHPPLDAWLPAMPSVTPNLDALAAHGVIFARAWSAGGWTRPGTVAMLAGARSGVLGLNATDPVPRATELSRFYAAHPPFLPLMLRQHGAVTRAFVDNYYITGYARAAVDVGLEGIVDHRYDTIDTQRIADDTLSWLRDNKDQRFMLFVNFNSPHLPYEPPAWAEKAIPKPPAAPSDPMVRKYLAEAHKDDDAVGRLVSELEALGIRNDTLVIVTADHGDTLSSEHDGVPLDLWNGVPPPGRFHHFVTIWEETTRIPIIMSCPKKLPQGKRVVEPIQNTDILPTVLELEGLPPADRATGRSLLPLLANGAFEHRPVISEGRGARSILDGNYHMIERAPNAQRVRTAYGVRQLPVELYDLATDPGERVEIAAHFPDVVARLKAELAEWSKGGARAASAPTVGLGAATAVTASATASGSPTASAPRIDHPSVHLRFSGAGAVHHVSGWLRAPEKTSDGTHVDLRVRPVALDARSVAPDRTNGYALDFQTSLKTVVGLDVELDPPTADLQWQLSLDDRPWPVQRIYAGSLGLCATSLSGGIVGASARQLASAEIEPIIDPRSELGLFVSRESSGPEIQVDNPAANEETMRLMQAWGYAHGPAHSESASAH